MIRRRTSSRKVCAFCCLVEADELGDVGVRGAREGVVCCAFGAVGVCGIIRGRLLLTDGEGLLPQHTARSPAHPA